MKKFPTYKTLENRQRKERKRERQTKLQTERSLTYETQESFFTLKETSR